MANNFTVRDGNNAVLTISSTDVGSGVEAPNHRVCDATAAHFLPTMDAAARGGYVVVTDLTNTMPTLDVAARAGYIYVTNGTQTMPTADAAARKLFAAVTDGTNTSTVKAASTGALATDTALVVRPMMGTDGTNTAPTADAAARALYAYVTNGTQTMPTADAAARKLFAAVTDGTNTATVKAASTGAAVTDTALVVRPLMPTDGTHAQPAGDAAARGVYVINSDGTTGVTVKGASTIAALTDTSLVVAPLQASDGTHVTPIGDAAARAIFQSITDGTNKAAVKAASTPAALTDPALVVAISPNSPLSKPAAGSPIRTSAKALIKGSAGALFSLTLINTTGSTVWAQFFDSALAATPTLGTTKPDLEFQVAANSTLSPNIPADGWPFGLGLVCAQTTTEAGATPGSAGDCLFFPTYV